MGDFHGISEVWKQRRHAFLVFFLIFVAGDTVAYSDDSLFDAAALRSFASYRVERV